MEVKDIIKQVKQYFKIQELVSKAVYSKYGEDKCWALFRPEVLETLLVIRRDILKVGLVCNDWVYGGSHHQRGWRENTSEIVSAKTKAGTIYASAHVLGAAFDVVSSKMDANKMRTLIIQNAHLLPYKIRIEDNVSWLHFDVCVSLSQSTKISKFTA